MCDEASRNSQKYRVQRASRLGSTFTPGERHTPNSRGQRLLHTDPPRPPYISLQLAVYLNPFSQPLSICLSYVSCLSKLIKLKEGVMGAPDVEPNRAEVMGIS